MSSDVEALETSYKGTIYRSRTEARWAVFFDILGVQFDYEKKSFKLSSGKWYLPDFYIHDFNVYFEVKPSNEDVVTEECEKARCLAKDTKEFYVWLAMGPPSADIANILPLSQWGSDINIGQILAVEENRYRILEDRRDHNIYWLHSEYVDGFFHHSYMVGGPGVSTDHDRLPLLHNTVLNAYTRAAKESFSDVVA